MDRQLSDGNFSCGRRPTNWQPGRIQQDRNRRATTLALPRDNGIAVAATATAKQGRAPLPTPTPPRATIHRRRTRTKRGVAAQAEDRTRGAWS
jgi:hypothetical protein